jgi:hypothetical protein
MISKAHVITCIRALCTGPVPKSLSVAMLQATYHTNISLCEHLVPLLWNKNRMFEQLVHLHAFALDVQTSITRQYANIVLHTHFRNVSTASTYICTLLFGSAAEEGTSGNAPVTGTGTGTGTGTATAVAAATTASPASCLSTMQPSRTTDLTTLNTTAVVVVCNNKAGGSFRYILDMQATFRNVKWTIVSKAHQLRTSTHIDQNTVVLVQSFLFTNITVQHILSLREKTKCRVVVPVHDWYWFVDPLPRAYDTAVHTKYLDEELTLPHESRMLFDAADWVWCPSAFVHEKVLCAYRAPDAHERCVLCPWGDYHIEANQHGDGEGRAHRIQQPIQEHTIHLAMMHSFSKYKGAEYMAILQRDHTQWNGYTIKYHHSLPHTEETFLQVLCKHHIHGLLHLNRWGETFCYSLTKTLLSELPVFYNNIGAYQTRIPKDQPTYVMNRARGVESQRESISGICRESFELFLEQVVAHHTHREEQIDADKKQDGEEEKHGTCEKNDANRVVVASDTRPEAPIATDLPGLVFSPLFTNVLSPISAAVNMVIITSKIHVSTAPLSYTPTRSIHTPQERFAQTLQTISSVRTCIPNAHIVLVDDSAQLKDAWVSAIDSRVDLFVRPEHTRTITDTSPYKGLGELAQLREALSAVRHLNMRITGLFKISGRYTVDPASFSYSQYIPDKSMFKRNKAVRDRRYYYTSFYKIAGSQLDAFSAAVDSCYRTYQTFPVHTTGTSHHHHHHHRQTICTDLEVLLPACVGESRFTSVPHLGIRQNIAVWDQRDLI